MKKYIYLMFLVFIISCNTNNRKPVVNKTSQKEARNETEKDQVSFTIDSFYNEYDKDSLRYLTIDLKTFQAYQTFDEFTMKPMGRHIRKTFVYYKKDKDTIYVIPSNNKKNVFVYIRHGNKWYNHRHIDFWRINYPVCKCRDFKFAHSYFRICGNDSIIECKSDYTGTTDTYHTIYIKTHNECKTIDLITEFKNPHTIYQDMLTWVHTKIKTRQNSTKECYIDGGKRNYSNFNLQESKNYFTYIEKQQNIKLVFHKNSLGLFAIQPGLERYNRDLSSSDKDW